MKNITKKLLALISFVLLISMILSACGIDSAETNDVSDSARKAHIAALCKEGMGKIVYTPQDEEYFTDPTGFGSKLSSGQGATTGLTEMFKVFGNKNYELYMDFKTTDIAILDLTTGFAYHSNPKRDPDTASSFTNKAKLLNPIASPLSVEAYDATGKYYSFNFYDNCYEEGEGNFYVVQTGENSLRLIYTIGNDPDKDLFPPVITEDTWQDRIVSGLQEKFNDGTIDQATYNRYEKLLNSCYREMTPDKVKEDPKTLERFEEYFPTINVMPMRISYDKVPTKQKRQIKELMELIGFTAEDVKKEMEKADYQGPERSVLYTIPVDLVLTEQGLSVTIDTEKILGPTKQRLYTINVYRALGGIRNVYKDSYMIVPDGAGAVIPATGKYSTGAYKARIYGNDASFSREYSMDKSQQVLAGYLIYDRGVYPETAARKNGGGVMAIIEKGAAQASVVARPIGSGNPIASINYELVYSERDYRTYSTSSAGQAQSSTGGEQGSGTLLSNEPVTGVFSIQYLFTEGGLTYSDYAAKMRTYYQEKQILPKEKLESAEVPLYVDLLGCVDLNETVLGIPVKKETALTTYAQAQQILKELKEAGVNNVVTRYSYWANGGENNTIAKDVDLLDCMGTQAELKELLAFGSKDGYSFYPSVEFLQVTSTANGFSKSQDAARRMNRSTATVVERMKAIGSLREDLDEKILVSSRVSAEIAATYEASFKDVLGGHKSIALGLLGDEIHSNYKTNNGVTRMFAEGHHVDVLKTFKSKNYDVAVSTGNLYTWNYATHIFNLPTGSSQYLMESTAIPFAQMLLHGYVNYSMEPLNTTGDYETALLLALETGSALSVRWMGADDSIFDYTSFYNYFSLNYKSTIGNLTGDESEAMKDRIYSVVSKELSGLNNVEITKHEAVDAYMLLPELAADQVIHMTIVRDAATGAPKYVDEKTGELLYEADITRISTNGGVFATVYGDQKVIIVNYNSFDVELPNRTTVSAKGFLSVSVEEYEKIIDDTALYVFEELPADPSDDAVQEG